MCCQGRSLVDTHLAAQNQWDYTTKHLSCLVKNLVLQDFAAVRIYFTLQ